MAHPVFPWWLGYWLIFPLRRLWQDPARIVGPYVRDGMTVLEPGPGMGFFSLELARRVGPSGRVVCVDVEHRMLDKLAQRTEKAGVKARIDARLARPESMGIDDLAGRVDFCLAFAVVHEFPDARKACEQIFAALRPGGRVLLAEPILHVRRSDFEATVTAAQAAGFSAVEGPAIPLSRTVLLERPEV